MYIDKLIKKEIVTLLVSVSLLVVIFIGVTYAKFLSVDNGKDTVINVGDLSIDFCNDTNCDSTYSNIGQVIGTKMVDGVSVPSSIYPFKNDGSYSNEIPYIFKVTNTGSLDSTVKIKLKEDATFVPTGDYSDYARLTSKYASNLKVAIRKRVLYKDTGYQLGDVNLDGFVNSEDANIILNAAAGTVTFNDVQKQLGDVNLDGSINNKDVILLTRLISGTNQLENMESIYIYNYNEIEDGIIYSNDVIKAGEEAIYFIWLYLDENTPNDAQKTYFAGNLDVVGEYIPVSDEPKSFSTDSWEIIIKAVKSGNTSKYNVGDTKTIDMGTYGTHTVRIANMSTPSECGTDGFSQTACGFVLEFADIVTTHYMSSVLNISGGWPDVDLYEFVNNDIYNAIPAELRNAIVSTIVLSSTSTDENGKISEDMMYLLSPKEIYGSDDIGVINDLTRQLDYYLNESVSTSNYNKVIKKYDNTNSVWWLRSIAYPLDYMFLCVADNGDICSNGDTNVFGVSPAFRIG